MDESGTDDAECSRKVAIGREVTGAITSLVNARSLQLECAMVLYESLLVPVFMYGSETMIWKEKERSRMRAVQMDNLRGLLSIRRMYEVPNTWISELCGVTKGGRGMKGLMVFSSGSAMWREWRIIVLLRGCILGNVELFTQWVGLGKSMDVRQERRIVYDRSQWGSL